ncbi:hypothetical protein FBQ85_14285 [Cytophagia bacterium CHB2]|nr:hypothetical protein [Cytophagia bacterium CHB2]
MMQPRSLTALLLAGLLGNAAGQERELGRIVLSEPAGLPRTEEYVEVSVQASLDEFSLSGDRVYAIAENSGKKIECQIFQRRILPAGKQVLFSIIFPVSLQPHERRVLHLKTGPPDPAQTNPATDLQAHGDALELRVENEFFVADLTSSTSSEGKGHRSGQLRELFIKSGFDQLLSRGENRIHWAPNFQRAGAEEYSTIAGWDSPRLATLEQGPYLIHTQRQDVAPDHPEILLSAAYKFYANQPYLRFVSTMEITSEISLVLLRNDEMTMDSLFTHVAFQRPGGEVFELPLAERYAVLERQPIEHDAPWLCFYHRDKGYAFGSIRLREDNTNSFGSPSPTFEPHTRISDGANGGKYWNRRLINERVTILPRGSRYAEENAYLVFKIEESDRFAAIKYWAERLRNPIRVH